MVAPPLAGWLLQTQGHGAWLWMLLAAALLGGLLPVRRLRGQAGLASAVGVGQAS
jgi:hypothetical protein